MSKKSRTFRVGRVQGYLRGKVWYLCYHEQGKRHRRRCRNRRRHGFRVEGLSCPTRRPVEGLYSSARGQQQHLDAYEERLNDNTVSWPPRRPLAAVKAADQTALAVLSRLAVRGPCEASQTWFAKPFLISACGHNLNIQAPRISQGTWQCTYEQ